MFGLHIWNIGVLECWSIERFIGNLSLTHHSITPPYPMPTSTALVPTVLPRSPTKPARDAPGRGPKPAADHAAARRARRKRRVPGPPRRNHLLAKCRSHAL